MPAPAVGNGAILILWTVPLAFPNSRQNQQAEWRGHNGRTEEKFGILENKIEEGFAKADKRFENLENKIDIVTNVNLAQILNEQTRTRNEITKKLDEYITKNEFEHKRFDYKLAELEMKFGYTAK